MKLYFIPFAGGSEISYSQIINTISKKSDISCIQCTLPGRGRRIIEDLVPNVSLMAEDLCDQIISTLDSEPYVIFGHSMGALLAVHVLSLLKDRNVSSPSHIFLSGRTGEIKKPDLPLRSEMSSVDFKNMLKNLGGIAEEILEDHDVMSFFEPIIKNDFSAIETYMPIEYKSDIPVTVFFGEEDEFDKEEAQAWQRITTQPVELASFSGGHFFIFDESTTLSEIIISKLKKV